MKHVNPLSSEGKRKSVRNTEFIVLTLRPKHGTYAEVEIETRRSKRGGRRKQIMEVKIRPKQNFRSRGHLLVLNGPSTALKVGTVSHKHPRLCGILFSSLVIRGFGGHLTLQMSMILEKGVEGTFDLLPLDARVSATS